MAKQMSELSPGEILTVGEEVVWESEKSNEHRRYFAEMFQVFRWIPQGIDLCLFQAGRGNTKFQYTVKASNPVEFNNTGSVSSSILYEECQVRLPAPVAAGIALSIIDSLLVTHPDVIKEMIAASPNIQLRS